MTDRHADRPGTKNAHSRPHAEIPPELRDRLKEHADTVPPEVAQRLATMRRAAVQELDNRQTARRNWTVIGAFAGSAAALVLAVILVFQFEGDPVNGSLLVDPEEMAAVEDLEILEDLEFLAWLESEAPDASQG